LKGIDSSSKDLGGNWKNIIKKWIEKWFGGLNIKRGFAVHHFRETLKSLMHGVFWQLSLKFGEIFEVESPLRML
jgi:hypothetical protein